MLNKRTDEIPADAVYVGRPSKWGNPFILGKHGNREDVVAAYGIRLAVKSELLDALGELRGRDLVCWCAPEACHADVLLKAANA